MAQYAYQGSEEQAAKALGKRLPISTKQSIEVCNAIRGKKISRAKAILRDAINKERAIKFTRATEGAGHKPGVGPGKYPVKTCKNILDVLESAEANAQNQGLSSDLEIVHAAAQQGSRGYRYGRHRGRKEKSTHVEIVVQEVGSGRQVVEEKDTEGEEPESEPEAEEPVEGESDEAGDEEKTEEQEESEEEPEEDESADEETSEEKDIPARSTIENKTKDEIKEYADEEYGIELSTNDLKKEMIDQFFEELEGDD